MKRAKTNVFVRICLHIAGFALCIIPPAVCALSYFHEDTQSQADT